MGEQGVCGGTAALSKLTSICGTSHRWGRAAAIPYTEITCWPSAIIWEQEECENSVEGVGPSSEPTPVPHLEDALMVNCLTKS